MLTHRSVFSTYFYYVYCGCGCGARMHAKSAEIYLLPVLCEYRPPVPDRKVVISHLSFRYETFCGIRINFFEN